jgi:hypothetical protein
MMWPFGGGVEPTIVPVEVAGIPAHCPDPGVGGTIAQGVAIGLQHAIEPMGILTTNIAISASIVIWIVAVVTIVVLGLVAWKVLWVLVKLLLHR